MVSTLVLGSGCSKKSEETAGPWEKMALNKIAEDEALMKEREELSEKQLETIDLYPFLDESTWRFGYMNSKGETVIEPQFKRAEDFNYINRLSAMIDENDKMNYLNDKGEFLLKDFISGGIGAPTGNLLTFVDEKGAYGVMDIQGNVILPPEYELLNISGDGYSIFCKDGKYGVANPNGDIIIEPIYDYIFGNSSGFIINNNNKYGVFDKNGKEIFPLIYGEYTSVAKDLFALQDESGKYAICNYQGEKITEHIYDEVNGYGRGLMIQVYQNGKCGYIDEKGEIIIDIKYDDLRITFDPRYAEIIVDGKHGIIDLHGKYLVEPKYDYITYGYDNSGLNLIKDCFIVGDDTGRRLIDKDGNTLREGIDDGVMIYEDFLLGSSNEYQFILLDLKGNDIAKFKYTIPCLGEYLLVKDEEEDTDGYVVDYYTGQIISEERFETIRTFLPYNRVVGTKGNSIYIMDKNLKVLGELKASNIGGYVNDIQAYNEELIKIEYGFDGILWVNSKGERIK